MNKINLSDEQLHTILADAVGIIRDAKVTNFSAKKMGKLSTIYAALFVVAAIIAALYFVMSSKIAPLMLVIATAIPVLAWGIRQQGKNLTYIEKEFLEYRNAVNDMITFIQEEFEGTLKDENDVTVRFNWQLEEVRREENDVIGVFSTVDKEDDDAMMSMIGTVVSTTLDAQQHIIQMRQEAEAAGAPPEDTSVVV